MEKFWRAINGLWEYGWKKYGMALFKSMQKLSSKNLFLKGEVELRTWGSVINGREVVISNCVLTQGFIMHLLFPILKSDSDFKLCVH
jgi:hypothetical protein